MQITFTYPSGPFSASAVATLGRERTFRPPLDFTAYAVCHLALRHAAKLATWLSIRTSQVIELAESTALWVVLPR